MIPVIAIVGRPNVGKSTLFNQLTKTKDALVIDEPGVTRDRKYGEGFIDEKHFIVIDTGGIGSEDENIDDKMSSQSWQAVVDADIILFLVDGQAGLISADEQIFSRLRKLAGNKKVFLVVNKTDGIDVDVAMGDFYQFSANPIPIAASKKRGINKLINLVLEGFESVADIPEKDCGIKVAIVGRPNVGKSTLVNRILGEERVVVFDRPGTTRDSIYIPFEREGEKYTLIDTAGVRRRGKVTETIEKFSVIKALQAIDTANVVVFVLDSRDKVVDQDLSLLDFVLETGRSLVVVFNKWDGLDDYDKQTIKENIGYKLGFVDFADFHFISALHGTGVGHIYDSVIKAYESSMKRFSTPELTKLLETAVSKHQPPLVRGRRIKLRYAHSGGHNPQRVIIHGNQTSDIPDSYKKYLVNFFRKSLNLSGSQVWIEFKSGDNPYAGKKNTLTPRQLRSKQRLMKHVKKKSK